MTTKNQKILIGGAITGAGVLAFTGIAAATYLAFKTAIGQAVGTISNGFKIGFVSFATGAGVAAILTGLTVYALTGDDENAICNKKTIITAGAIAAAGVAFTGIASVTYITFETAIKQAIETMNNEFKISFACLVSGAGVAAILTGLTAYALIDHLEHGK